MLLTAAICFITLAGYTRKAAVSGVLVPDRGLIRMVPTQAGTVVERRATEGQSVHAGEVLFVLALDNSLLNAPAQAEVLRSLDERERSLRATARQQQLLAESQAASMSRRLQAMTLELAQLDTEASLQQQRLALAHQSLSRLESLRNDQFVSPAQVQAKHEEVIGLQAAAQALERQRAALARERAALEGEQRELPLAAQNVQGTITRDLAAVAREVAEQSSSRQLVVRAPQDGTVSAVLAEVGQSVSPASALASLVPAGAHLQAHLFAPSSAIGFVRPEQAVRLRYEAFPYQRFGQHGARVVAVSRAPLAASELAALSLPAAAAAPAGEGLFRITVALDEDGAQLPLVPGMRLQADVLLERRRLIEWLFEPLLGLRRRL